MIHKSLTY